MLDVRSTSRLQRVFGTVALAMDGETLARLPSAAGGWTGRCAAAAPLR
jgi:hypothetical protein